MIKRITAHKIGKDNKAINAIIHPFNCYFRVLDGDNKEYFFREYTHALKHLINDGYFIHF